MTPRLPTGRLPAATFVLAMTAVPATPALAQQPAPVSTPSPIPEAPKTPKVEAGGWVDLYYGYNFNGTDPSLRTYDVQHNAFSLSAAEVNLSKIPSSDSRVGFRTDLWLGQSASLTAAFEPEEGAEEIYKHVQQAYVSLLTGKVQWDAGKFVTPMGAEVIESQDNWNYTRSILFGYAIPFYHLGVRATVPVSDKLSLSGYLTNGWNNVSEIDGAKTIALGTTLRPTGSLTWVANYMLGKEAEGLDTRHLLDTTLTLAASDRLSFMGNFDYGQEGDVSWWGVAAYGKLQAMPSWAVAARFEYLDDRDGGFMTFGTRARSITVTSDHTIAGALKARLEYRTDFSDQDIFVKDDGSLRGSQSTLTVGVVCYFKRGLF
jgi:hypothetical protein